MTILARQRQKMCQPGRFGRIDLARSLHNRVIEFFGKSGAQQRQSQNSLSHCFRKNLFQVHNLLAYFIY
jgi:hypothetical protein